MTISPASGPYETTAAIRGAGFTSGEKIDVYWDMTNALPISTGTAATDGSFDGAISVPQAVSGAHTVIAVGQSSRRSVTAGFMVTAKDMLLHIYPVPGEQNVIKGTGFAAHEMVKTYWRRTGAGSMLLGSSTTNSLGTFTGLQAVTFTTPMSPTGIYGVVSIGQTSHGVYTSTVNLRPTLSITPANGAPGTRIIASGSGYGPRETVTLRWDCSMPACASTRVLGTALTDSNGSFANLSILIPTNATTAIHPIEGLGQITGAFANAHFTVTP